MISDYLLIILAILILLIIAEKFISINRIKKARKYFKYFTGIEKIGGFAEVHPYFHFSGNKEGESVLLIHGFSASSSEFRFLVEEMKKKNITYYAPMLTGFGIDDFHLLQKIKYNDWLRDVVYGYDLLKQISSKISVVGHSMGGLLALHLASMREINKIVLTSPYLVIKDDHKWGSRLIRNRYIWNLLSYFNPVLSKEGSKNASKLEMMGTSRRFAIPVFPLSIVRELWSLLEDLNYERIKRNEVLIICGKNDTTVIPEEVRKLLAERKFEYIYTEFRNSGHNLLEEKERGEVISRIIEFIN